MSFVQFEFPILVVTLLTVYWAVGHRTQNLLLLGGSLLFYGWVHPAWLGLLIGSATLGYTTALGMAQRPQHRLALLRVSLVGNALILGTFKYFDFFVGSVEAALGALGLHLELPLLGVVLPAGISFYTFQSISYTIDVYRGDTPARTHYLDYLLYLAFFPQLVAGPIERATHLLPQLESPRTFSLDNLRSGLGLALWGAFKKVVIADTVARYVNGIYGTPEPSWAMAWAGCVGFMVQILADFTGYTDIARGVARMFGIELMRNFNHPYLATSPMDLWDRWHISLSSWLRDYVFYPVSTWRWGRRWLRIPGMRETGMTTLARATIITMLGSGLWHGAAWHFVLWGAYWAAIQIVYLTAERRVPRAWRLWPYRRPLLMLLMIPTHLVAHQLFREPTLHRLGGYFFGSPFDSTTAQLIVAAMCVSVAAVGAVVLLLGTLWEQLVLPRLANRPVALPVETTLWCAAVWLIVAFGRQGTGEFLYFAF